MRKIPIQYLTEATIVIALYVALTYLFYPLSYGAIQFRISEILVLLVLYKRSYAIPLILACFLSNIGSSLGAYDMLFGTLATALAIIPMLFIKNLYIGASFPVLANMFIIPVELALALGYDMFEPAIFFMNVLSVGIGEAVVIYLLGIPFMISVHNNKSLMRKLSYDEKVVVWKLEFLNSYTLGCFSLGVIFIISYFSYPLAQINENVNETAFYYTKEGLYFLIAFPILSFIFIVKGFFIKNKKISMITSIINIIAIMSILVLGAVYIPELRKSGLYYLLYLIIILGMLPDINRWFGFDLNKDDEGE